MGQVLANHLAIGAAHNLLWMIKWKKNCTAEKETEVEEGNKQQQKQQWLKQVHNNRMRQLVGG